MSQVFISYSRKDASNYVEKLIKSCIQNGINVWTDNSIRAGSNYPKELEKALDECLALIVIITPDSRNSSWVQNELTRAVRKKKEIFPLLLQGSEEPLLQIESIQYTDVRGEKLPPQKFFTDVKNTITNSSSIWNPSLGINYPTSAFLQLLTPKNTTKFTISRTDSNDRKCNICVDGSKIGTISSNSTKTFDLEPGNRIIWADINYDIRRYGSYNIEISPKNVYIRSNEIRINVNSQDEYRFVCNYSTGLFEKVTLTKLT